LTDLDAGLARLGFDAYRPGQREAIETLLEDGRLLLVAPTGGGKSLTYQVPALLLPGTTLVISPLISLMADQVAALEARGVAATFLASTLAPDEMRERMRRIGQGAYDLVYAAPERLGFAGFRSTLAGLDCPLVAIDEAHCISEWGHDFRPEYMQIGAVLKDFPDSRVLACTATATPVVRDEILERLGLSAQTPQLIYGFARPNLALRVSEAAHKRDRDAAVDAALREALTKPGGGSGSAILYCPTRKITEAEAERLSGRGWTCGAYHAGRDARSRDDVHRAFSAGELEIVVATNAFGMGIDRADVRAVVHVAPPGSIEAYYQEVGRAGRDGEPALGLMVVSPGDMARRRALLELDTADGVANAEVIEHKWALFLELMRYSEGGSCRHDAILRYFGDEAETLAGCGRCDVCAEFASDADEAVEPEQVTLIVRKALSAVARVHGRFGITAAVAVLRGAKDERLQRTGIDNTTTFGILREHSEDWLTRLLRRCVTAGWVDFFGADRPVVALTESGKAVMRGDVPARLLLPPRHVRKVPAATFGGERRSRRSAATPDADALDSAAQSLFEALREHRLEVAGQLGVPPYVVATDRSLREIAAVRPAEPEDLLAIHGIGPAKVEKFGPGLLRIVRDHPPS
jgi:ATP-dependent DNA helicase RecQ